MKLRLNVHGILIPVINPFETIRMFECTKMTG